MAPSPRLSPPSQPLALLLAGLALPGLAQTVVCTPSTGGQRPRVASTAIRAAGGSLDFIRKFLYKIQPNQFHTILLYNRGTEPEIILFYHPDAVQVPQVPRM